VTAAYWKKKLAAIKGKTVIGLTGPIASGKSLALECFRREGAFCLSSDGIAAEVLTSPACYNKILKKFSPNKILTNGLLDKKRLAAEVFGSASKRRWLESLLHPEILGRTHSLIIKSRAKIAVVEAPLLFEAGLQDCFMLTVCLAAPERTLEKRALARGWSRAEYRARVKAQLPAERKYALSSLVLDNSAGPRELRTKIRFLCGFLEDIHNERKR
jgi:dephospho-CoA kinase